MRTETVWVRQGEVEVNLAGAAVIHQKTGEKTNLEVIIIAPDDENLPKFKAWLWDDGIDVYGLSFNSEIANIELGKIEFEDFKKICEYSYRYAMRPGIFKWLVQDLVDLQEKEGGAK